MRYDMVENANIRETRNVTDVNEWITERRRLWNERISVYPISNTRLVKMTRDNKRNTRTSESSEENMERQHVK